MSVNVEQLDNSFVGVVSGLDTSKSLSSEVIEQIKGFIAEYPVLCFRNQVLDDDQQAIYAEQFGELMVNEYPELGGNRDGSEKLLFISTVDKEGKKFEKDSLFSKMFKANFLWHSDGTHMERSTRYTSLSARILPSVPPPTEYVDLRQAWDDLPEARKKQIENLKVVHSILASRAKMGMNAEDFTEETLKKSPSVIKPLVRINPISGRKSLYLASHAASIESMSMDEGRQLIDELTEHATQKKYRYSHQWQAHDLLMWDNFCLMHRATPYDGEEPRYLRWAGSLEPLK